MTAQTAVSFADTLELLCSRVSALRGFTSLLTSALDNERAGDELHGCATEIAILLHQQMDGLDGVIEDFHRYSVEGSERMRFRGRPARQIDIAETLRSAVDVDAIAQSLNTDRATVEGVLQQLMALPSSARTVGNSRARVVNG